MNGGIIFKIGDRVRCVNDYVNQYLKGKIGKVIEIQDWIGVEFSEEFPQGHDCSGKGKPNRCWRLPRENLILLKKEIWDN